ncbi:hypothetical protein [Rhizobium rhizosphaerae]|uniref:hypothetical protein n=1 Tax=Xaviernesmea rhizosphaerae TaxID=1672749 RepID=UPI00111AEE01|nr:hypothetical protein [Xaviernesmea rhizosphaerae]
MSITDAVKGPGERAVSWHEPPDRVENEAARIAPAALPSLAPALVPGTPSIQEIVQQLAENPERVELIHRIGWPLTASEKRDPAFPSGPGEDPAAPADRTEDDSAHPNRDVEAVLEDLAAAGQALSWLRQEISTVRQQMESMRQDAWSLRDELTPFRSDMLARLNVLSGRLGDLETTLETGSVNLRGMRAEAMAHYNQSLTQQRQDDRPSIRDLSARVHALEQRIASS